MITTIIMPVSRDSFLDKVFKSLEALICDPHRTNLVVIVDGESDLFVKARNMVQESKFAQRLCVQLGNEKARRWNIGARRIKIAKLHNELKKYIPESDFIFGTEDDTIVPPDAIVHLRTNLLHEKNIGLVSGVEVGRWGVPYIGAWIADYVFEPTKLTTVEYKRKGLEFVDATGFYCFIVRYSLYMEHDFKTFDYNSLGADVEFGLHLRQLGYANVINWAVPCGHLDAGEKLLMPSKESTKITYTKGKTTWRLN